jgi:hypothetical protein
VTKEIIIAVFLSIYFTGFFTVGIMSMLITKRRAGFWLNVGSFVLWPGPFVAAIYVLLGPEK